MGWEGVDVDNLVFTLRSTARAYPEEAFPSLTDEDRAVPGADRIITRASAGMGRHFADLLMKAADRIEELEEWIAERDSIASERQD